MRLTIYLAAGRELDRFAAFRNLPPMKIAVLASLFVLAPVAASAMPMQFDLICSGNDHIEILKNGVIDRVDEYHDRYRIDFESRRWCRGECVEAHAIIGATTTVITLAAGPVKDGTAEITINRTSGHLDSKVHQFGDGMRTDTYDADCKPAPFSGMPNPMF